MGVAESPTSSMRAAASHAVSHHGPGAPLEPTTRGTLESRIGVNFSEVRIHSDSQSRRANAALKSRAFTHRNHIWLGQGESQHDLRLMAHETTHVLQQDGIVRRSPLNEEEIPTPISGEARVPAAISVTALPSTSTAESSSEAPVEVALPETVPPVERVTGAEGAAAPLGEAMPVAAPTAGSAAEGGLGVELLMPEAPSELSEDAQARLEEAQRNAGGAAATEEELPSADASTSDARGAVQEPQQETAARAESGLMSALQVRAARQYHRN